MEKNKTKQKKEFSLQIALDIKRRSNEAVSRNFSANLLFLNGKLWKRKPFCGSLSRRFEQLGEEHDSFHIWNQAALKYFKSLPSTENRISSDLMGHLAQMQT